MEMFVGRFNYRIIHLYLWSQHRLKKINNLKNWLTVPLTPYYPSPSSSPVPFISESPPPPPGDTFYHFIPLTAEFLCVFLTLNVWRIHTDNIQHHCLTLCSPPQHYPCSIAPPIYTMEEQPESTPSAPALLSCAHHRSTLLLFLLSPFTSHRPYGWSPALSSTLVPFLLSRSLLTCLPRLLFLPPVLCWSTAPRRLSLTPITLTDLTPIPNLNL